MRRAAIFLLLIVVGYFVAGIFKSSRKDPQDEPSTVNQMSQVVEANDRKESETSAKEKTKSDLSDQVKGSTTGAKSRTESAHSQFLTKTRVDESKSDEQKLSPQHDGWQSEDLAEKASVQIKRLLKKVAGNSGKTQGNTHNDVTSLLADPMLTTPIRPEKLVDVLTDPMISVRRQASPRWSCKLSETFCFVRSFFRPRQSVAAISKRFCKTQLSRESRRCRST